MNSARIVLAVIALSGIATSVTAAEVGKMKGRELAGQATIKLDAARVIALKARPGTITDQELEKEKGGSGLRYSFDITSHGKPYEVGVDAKSGVLLENATEGKKPD